MEMKAPNISIASMAMLVELRISTWTARKRDVTTTDDLNRAKNATDGASNVYKYLMAGSDHLKKIEKYAAKCRAWNGQQTLPWMKGIGLLPMQNFFDYRQQLGTMEFNFNALVSDFIVAYPTLVSAQAFNLGTYFDPTEFPDADTLPRKFKFAVTGAAKDRAAIQFHDIGIQVVKNDAGDVGYAVYVGGEKLVDLGDGRAIYRRPAWPAARPRDRARGPRGCGRRTGRPRGPRPAPAGWPAARPG